MSRQLAIAHILLGLLGLLCCIVMFVRYARPMQNVVSEMGKMAESTGTELKQTISMAEDGEQVLNSLRLAADANRQALTEADRLLDNVCTNLHSWKLQLEGFGRTAEEASQVTANFATVLPLDLPVLTYRMEVLRYGVPTIALKEQTVELPFPTAKLGTRKETVDLGITELNFNMPTLELGTGQRRVTVPANPVVNVENRELTVPSDFKVDTQQLLAKEKLVLQRVSDDLREAATNFNKSAMAMDELEGLANKEVRRSFVVSTSALTETIEQLETLGNVSLPEFRTQLQVQYGQLTRSQVVFREIGQAIPWTFALFSLLPIGMVLQGLWMLSRSQADRVRAIE